MQISYGKQYIDDDDIQAVVNVLRSDFLTQGPAVSKFENDICEMTGAKYCVVVGNATQGLHIAVSSLEINPNMEGITSPNTFLASANCLVYNGLKPVFADIDPHTYNIDKNEINKKITNKTKMLIPVHFAGQSCDMDTIFKIAKQNNLFVIEDAAHAIGSFYKDGSPVGNCKYSDMTVFSFHPVKTITTGEGGAITTNNKALYEKLLYLRSHGIERRPEYMHHVDGRWYYEMQHLGYNFRMTDMQAALGSSQLKKISFFRTRRREIITIYNEAFRNIDCLTIPYEEDGLVSCFHLYVLKIDFEKIGLSREIFMDKLSSKGINTQVHYIPVHLQPYYKDKFGYKQGDYPQAEAYYARALSLPLYPGLSDSEVNATISSIKELCQ